MNLTKAQKLNQEIGKKVNVLIYTLTNKKVDVQDGKSINENFFVSKDDYFNTHIQIYTRTIERISINFENIKRIRVATKLIMYFLREKNNTYTWETVVSSLR